MCQCSCDGTNLIRVVKCPWVCHGAKVDWLFAKVRHDLQEDLPGILHVTIITPSVAHLSDMGVVGLQRTQAVGVCTELVYKGHRQLVYAQSWSIYGWKSLLGNALLLPMYSGPPQPFIISNEPSKWLDLKHPQWHHWVHKALNKDHPFLKTTLSETSPVTPLCTWHHQQRPSLFKDHFIWNIPTDTTVYLAPSTKTTPF